MRVEAPVAGAKGLMQRVEAIVRATLPRQARVTRTEGNSVWVKFLGDGATDPESKFPSTVAGVPPDTMGWVITLGGRKGLFVVTGMIYPITDSVGGSMSVTATSSGFYWNTSVTATIENLNPNRQYTIEGHPSIRTTGTSARRFVPRFEAIGATEVRGSILTVMASRDQEVTKGMDVIRLYPNADGVITLKPGFQWISGTVSCNYTELVYTIS